MRSARSLSRSEAIGSTLGFLLLSACAGQGSIASLSNAAFPRGRIVRRRTLSFPVARPDGSMPPLHLASGETPQDTSDTLTYEGYTAVLYSSESYAEFYDPSGNLLFQMSGSVDDNGILTIDATGQQDSATVTGPQPSAVEAAGGATLGTATGTIDTSSETGSMTDSSSGLSMTLATTTDGSMTIDPPDSLPPIETRIEGVGSGSGGSGGCNHGCPQDVRVQSVSDCGGAIIAAAIIAALVADALANGVVAGCAGSDGTACAVLVALAAEAMAALGQWLSKMVSSACAQ